MKTDIFIQKINEKLVKQDTEKEDFSVLTGTLSKAFFYATQGIKKDLVISEIQNTLEYISLNIVNDSFVDGLAGFGWGVNKLSRSGFIPYDSNEILSNLDIHLKQKCIQSINAGEYEFFYGFVGYMIYFLERLKSKPELREVVEELAFYFFNNNNNNNNNNSTSSIWQTPKEKEENIIEFGLSHGNSSIIILCALLIEQNILVENCEKSIRKIFNFISKNSVKNNPLIKVPDVVENSILEHSPMRWCRGQLGLTYSLAKANQYLKDERIEEFIKKSAKTLALKRDYHKEELFTPNFCHGSFGVSHVLSKIANLSKLDFLIEPSNYWYEIGLQQLSKQIDKTYTKKNGKRTTGLLTGIEGVGMLLLERQNYSKLKEWDACLLM